MSGWLRVLAVAIGLLATSPLVPNAALADDGSPVVRGTFQILSSDDFVHHRGSDTYRLATDHGTFDLRFVQPAPVLPAAGTAVAVQGLVSGATILVEPGGLSSITPDVATPTAVTGAKRVAVLLVNFSDDTAQPVTVAAVRGSMFTNSDSVAAYYGENSWNKLTLAGDVFGWFTIPNSSTGCDWDAYATAADAAATAAGVNLATYDKRIYEFPPVCGNAAFAYLGGSQVWISGDGSELQWTAIQAHELGHTFGLDHANTYECSDWGVRVALSATSDNCYSVDYGDPFGGMGNYWVNNPGAPYDLSNFERGYLGWLTAANTQDVAATGTYTLAPIETYNPTGVQAIRVAHDPTTYVMLEFRQPYGTFDNFSGSDPVVNGVSVRLTSSYASTSTSLTNLIDATPQTASDCACDSAGRDQTLTVGQSFVDPVSHVVITTQSVSSAGAVVKVDFSPGTTTPPSVTTPALAPALAPPGTPVAVTATASSSNGIASGAVTIDGALAGTMGASGGMFGGTTEPLAGSVGAPAVEVDAGERNTCSLVTGGTVRCWGDNLNSQLGNGQIGASPIPVPVSGLGNVVSIATSSDHTCALLSDTTVRCWGSNSVGQLGNGTFVDSRTPVTVSGLTGVTAISARSATCALLSGGTVKCWGNGSAGQLGNGTTANSSTPVTVVGINDATSISGSCALLSGGTVRCWGWNMYGQLGDGTTTDRSTPVTVSGLAGATAISAGGAHTCAVVANGATECWGLNVTGELGDGTTTNRTEPVAVSGLTGATAIDAGDLYHTCALLPGGTMECWGDNYNGQLGDGTTTNRLMPVAVSGVSGATAIALGLYHTCALIHDGSLACWGYNAQGQLGNGSHADSALPVPVSGIGTLSNGTHQVCVLARDTIGYATPTPGACATLVVSPPPATYVPLNPTRILDTRNGTGGLSGPFTNHVARTFTVSGVPSNAVAVTGNLTVTGQTSSGYFFIGPVATNNPTSSTLNFPAGDDRANAVSVALGAGGTLSITLVAPRNGPTAHAIFDLTGYFTPNTSGATYHALTPTRALDTRNGTGGLAGPFTNHAARTFTVSGIPAGATAVTGNLTVTGQTSSGYFFIGPVATNNPTSSTLNFPLGDDRANAVTVALSNTGTLSITFVAPSNGPSAYAIFDVTGYFTADMTGATYVPLTPTRLLDTRNGTGGLSGPFTNHGARAFGVTGGSGGVPSNAVAVTGNLTVTGQTSSGYLYIGPTAMNNPTSSTLNFPTGDDRANAVTVALGSGTLSITFVAPSNGPSAHAIFDVTGYFVP